MATLVMHASQSQYVLSGYVEGNQGLLAKFTCVYCGSGDYVLSPAMSPFSSDATDGPVEEIVESSVDEEISQCCAPVIPPLNTVPEPGTGMLLVLALGLAVIVKGLTRF